MELSEMCVKYNVTANIAKQKPLLNATIFKINDPFEN